MYFQVITSSDICRFSNELLECTAAVCTKRSSGNCNQKKQQINKNSKWKPKKIGKKRTSHQRVKQCLLNWYNRCWKSSFIFRPSIKIVPIQLTFGGLLIFRFGCCCCCCCCIYFSRHAYFSLAFGWSLPFVVLLFSLNFWSVVAVVLKWMVHYRLESDNIYKGKKKITTTHLCEYDDRNDF